MSVLFARIYDTSAEFDDRYVPKLEGAIARWGGIIAPSVGNAIVGLFAEEVDKSLEASLSMLECFAGSQYAKGSTLHKKIGIGIDTGTLLSKTDNGGDVAHLPYIVKDTQYIAARVEALTQVYETPLLITHRTFLQLSQTEGYHIRLIHRFEAENQRDPISVFEVFNGDPIAIQTAKLETKTQFEQGLFLYFMGFVEEAEHLFEECLEINQSDRVVQLYYERCQASVLRVIGTV
ncbi:MULTISPECIES: hypothetical protein [Spirulina sp. CCY15215]|uniref:hypothetical protein n=1 Tax=Spirulina sp. CCY15215 TaxID=2767591 RepID=UPI001951C7FF|nr:hypothetical protein [Spirulina major]